jgi:Fic family protein
MHPILKAIILHFMIGYIHPFADGNGPFADGNGRTARALFYWSVLKSGYWLFEYVSISRFIQSSRAAYDTAFIYTETDDFDLTYFLYNQCGVIRKAVIALHDHLEQKQQGYADFVSWAQQAPVAKTLRPIQLEVLQEAVREPGKEFTAKTVAVDYGVTENTARAYLNELVSRDLLVAAQAKRGKTVRYLAPARLRDTLRPQD